MMYIPILKTRRSEINVIKELNYCFSDDIIPMFEIINMDYGLDVIKEIMKGKKAFIDLFRFSIKKYGNKIDLQKVQYSWDLSEDENLYINDLNAINDKCEFIPVISIKKDFATSQIVLNQLIDTLQNKHIAIAIRITDEYIDEYEDVFSKLRNTDYLMLDIGEQNPDSKFIEIEEFSEIETLSKKIILNSPRLKDRKNGDYDNGITNNIDTTLIDIVEESRFEGFGDYMGLKDTMPENQSGSNGIGNALALLYDYKINKFYCFINKDKNMGMAGYRDVKREILNVENELNSENDCPAFKKIKEIDCGNWSIWHNITAKRYIHQIYKKNQQS